MAWEVPRALAYERIFGGHALQAMTRDGIAPLPGLSGEAYDAACALACEQGVC